MKRAFWIGLTVGGLTVGAAGGALLLRGGDAGAAAPPGHTFTPRQQEAIEQLKAFSEGFAAVADAVRPSVVTIASERVVEPADAPMSPFSDPLFRRFFDVPRTPQRQRGLGSGVIVQSDGHILTNNHVIRGADELTVVLQDGQRLRADVVGADPRTDIAVLKVDAKDLPALPFGDSDRVRTGEWVLAVGSPFSENLSSTITSGIVSGKGRSGMRLNDYEDFIQTDAAVNPGNSGGALVNLDGELIGINTAIASRAGGYDGISFAIPANMALDVMNDLIRDGKVTRGWLGVGIQNLTADIAEAMNLDLTHGVLVTSVEDGGPAAAAGVETQDVIVGFGGNEVKDTDQLRLQVARTDPGKVVDLEVIREGRRRNLDIRLGEYPEDETPVLADARQDLSQGLGLEVASLTPELARRFEIESGSGVVITGVQAGSPAAEAGIQPGDLIRKVNQRKVGSPRDVREAVERTGDGKPVLLQIQRGQNNFFVAVRPGR